MEGGHTLGIPVLGMRTHLLGILLTYECTAACASCCWGSRPGLRIELATEQVRDYIRQAARVPALRAIVFTGGEPFLKRRRLEDCVAFAFERGFRIRVVSNGYWATSRERAFHVLERLRERGLSELNMSVDDFHQEFVPLSHVRHVLDACEALDLVLVLAIGRTRKTRIDKAFLCRYLGLDPDQLPVRVHFYESPVVPAGRAYEIPVEELITIEELCGRADRCACPFVFREPAITPHRQLHACCGVTHGAPGLLLGNLDEEDLPAILEREEKSLILNWIAFLGPHDVLDTVTAQVDRPLPLRPFYVSMCDLCHHLLSDPKLIEAVSEVAPSRRFDVAMRRGMVEASLQAGLRPAAGAGEVAGTAP